MEEPFKSEKEEKFRKNCMFQGIVECCGRVCCDSIGDDMSPEFCKYCQHLSRTYNFKPYKVAELLFKKIDEVTNELKISPENFVSQSNKVGETKCCGYVQ